MSEPCVYQLADAFNHEFSSIRVELSPGSNEPFYRAPTKNKTQAKATIFSNQDFFSSALHEIAHWCLAGEKRRLLDDYGYWYAPDGRNDDQQAEFFKVEVKPQALEWAFHLAAKKPFQFSLDNLNSTVCERQIFQFKENVHAQLAWYFQNQFPARALQMIQLLCQKYNSNQPIVLPTHIPNG